ncbi:MAG: glutathione S-transferase family protein [Hyphomonadaceae bacterium]|nr:glutathione S-transferase family protein [Hyphomonadaceae bacterium]
MTKLEIMGAPQSPFVWAVRMAACEKGIAFETSRMRPHEPGIVALNPFGKIPVMRCGDVELSESRAIMSYIDQAFEGPALMPRELLANVRAEQWVARMLCEVMPVLTWRYVAQYIFPSGPDAKPDRAAIDAALPIVEKHLAILDRALALTPYLGGDAFTLADCYALPILTYTRQMPEGGQFIARLQSLAAYLDREAKRASYIASTPPPIADADRVMPTPQAAA